MAPPPTVDIELISLPFLLFSGDKLRTANAGARVLLGLVDSNLDVYSYEALFPPDAAIPPELLAGKPKHEGHLEILRAKVQSSQEFLKLKAAVYTSNGDGLLRSMLIVDVSVLIQNPGPSIHGPLQTSPRMPRKDIASSNSNTAGDPSISGITALDRTSSRGSVDTTTASPTVSSTGQSPSTPTSANAASHSHSLPAVIKRHSGDIRKIFGATLDRRKASHASTLSQQQQNQAPSNVPLRPSVRSSKSQDGADVVPKSHRHTPSTGSISLRAALESAVPPPINVGPPPLSAGMTRSPSSATSPSALSSSTGSQTSSTASSTFPPGFSAAMSAMSERSKAEELVTAATIASQRMEPSGLGILPQDGVDKSPTPEMSPAHRTQFLRDSPGGILRHPDEVQSDAIARPSLLPRKASTGGETPMPFRHAVTATAPSTYFDIDDEPAVFTAPPFLRNSSGGSGSRSGSGMSGGSKRSNSLSFGSASASGSGSGSASAGSGRMAIPPSSSETGISTALDGRPSSVHSAGSGDLKRSSAVSLDMMEASAGLAQSALAAHPRTGVLISRRDLSSGFINSRTRELLMGIKSPSTEISDPFDDNWQAPRRSATRMHRPSVHNLAAGGNASHFRSGLAATSVIQEQIDEEDERNDDYDDVPGDSPGWEDELDFYYGNDKIRIDLPDRGENLATSVSDILRWSLKRRRFRQQTRLFRDDQSTRSGESPTPSVSGLTTPNMPPSAPSASAKFDAPKAPLDDGAASRPWIAQKPYKVFDTSFSQRVEDPFERLFDLCVRKGQQPPDAPILVGIETEVGPPDVSGFPDSECFTIMTESTDSAKPIAPIRVRRRLVQVRAAPLKGNSGEHIGGVVWLRDITGESLVTATVPVAGPGQASVASPMLGSLAAVPGYPAPSPTNASSDPFWQQIINNMPQMVWVTKPDGQHIYFNNKWYAYTGLQPEQSLGVNWQNPFHPDDMPNSRRAWSRSLATGEPYSVEYRCRRHDGVWRWQLGRAQSLLDGDGKIVAWFGTCTDVDEFVKLREQLADTSRNLRRVIDLANITLICVDKDIKITLMEGGGWVARVSPETSPIGVHLGGIIDSPELIQHVTEVLNGANSARLSVQTPPGTWIGCELTPLRTSPEEVPQGVVIVTRDITNLKAAEAALKQLYQEQSRLLASETAAKEASRLKSEFTANLSHEIRTPITGMIGMSELLLEEDMTPAQHDSVRKILKSGEILLKMVGDVLDIGKVEAGKLELDIQPFVLTDLVSDATTMFRTAARKKGLKFIEERSNLYEGEILGDLPRMRQVLLNFLANSVKFTKQGLIRLRVQQDNETADSVETRFVVEDSGIGIASNVIPMLFQPFQQADSTTSREHGGTGLGLAISKRLVEMMDGTVTMDSELGKGTSITVVVPFRKNLRLPAGLLRRESLKSKGSSDSTVTAGSATPERARLSPDAKAQMHTALSPMMTEAHLAPDTPASVQEDARENAGKAVPKEIVRKDIWILLAEDNLLNQEIFVRGIKRMGFNIHAVNNGKEALDALEERDWDLLLLDWHMPIMDGATATREIRKSTNSRIRNTTIIALTASAVTGDRERCIAAGMDGYLSKPVRLKLLEETIMDYLSTETPRQLQDSKPA